MSDQLLLDLPQAGSVGRKLGKLNLGVDTGVGQQLRDRGDRRHGSANSTEVAVIGRLR